MTQPFARLPGGLTYANSMSTLAVFIALGGGAYAAARLPHNSVGAQQIRANAVGASEIRASAVRSSELHDGSVTLRDLSAGAQSALRGAQGPAGTAAVTY